VASLRIAGLTLLPATSGLLLSLAFCGATPSRKEESLPCSPTIGLSSASTNEKAIESISIPQPTLGPEGIATALLSEPLAKPTASSRSEPIAAEPGGLLLVSSRPSSRPPAAQAKRRYTKRAEQRERTLAVILCLRAFNELGEEEVAKAVTSSNWCVRAGALAIN
jgi:hypothetical protein